MSDQEKLSPEVEREIEEARIDPSQWPRWEREIAALRAQVETLKRERDEALELAGKAEAKVASLLTDKELLDQIDVLRAQVETLTERLDQFDAYGMPNVTTALDRINAAEAREREALAEVERLKTELEKCGKACVELGGDAEKAEADLAALREGDSLPKP